VAENRAPLSWPTRARMPDCRPDCDRVRPDTLNTLVSALARRGFAPHSQCSRRARLVAQPCVVYAGRALACGFGGRSRSAVHARIDSVRCLESVQWCIFRERSSCHARPGLALLRRRTCFRDDRRCGARAPRAEPVQAGGQRAFAAAAFLPVDAERIAGRRDLDPLARAALRSTTFAFAFDAGCSHGC
jgi:hypothetical protein